MREEIQVEDHGTDHSSSLEWTEEPVRLNCQAGLLTFDQLWSSPIMKKRDKSQKKNPKENHEEENQELKEELMTKRMNSLALPQNQSDQTQSAHANFQPDTGIILLMS